MVAALNLVANVDNWPIAESTDLLPPVFKFRGVFGGRFLVMFVDFFADVGVSENIRVGTLIF